MYYTSYKHCTTHSTSNSVKVWMHLKYNYSTEYGNQVLTAVTNLGNCRL